MKKIEDKEVLYEFYDIFNENVLLDYINIINLIEGQKIYIFHSFKINKDSNERYHLHLFQKTRISSWPVPASDHTYHFLWQ